MDGKAARGRPGMKTTCCGARWSALFMMFGLLGCQRGAPANVPAGTNIRPSMPAISFVGSKAGEEREIDDIKLCWCPPGRFRMGSPPDEPDRRPDEAQVDVALTRGFWMGKYEVTQGQWKRIAGALPGGVTLGEGDDSPVHSVNYEEALEFCRRLTALARASVELPDEWEFRLPTEAQWEYACRAGTTAATAFGDRLSRDDAKTVSDFGISDLM